MPQVICKNANRYGDCWECICAEAHDPDPKICDDMCLYTLWTGEHVDRTCVAVDSDEGRLALEAPSQFDKVEKGEW